MLCSIMKCGKKIRLGAPQIGISNGTKPGDVGVWIAWDEKTHPTEVFRVSVAAVNKTKIRKTSITSYTFGPAFEKSFCRSIEFQWEIKQFLLGSDREKEGDVYFEAVLTSGATLSLSVPFKEVIRAIRGKLGTPPEQVVYACGSQDVDKPEVAKLKASELKAYSESVKQQLEEKRKKEEEEAKKREADKAAAAAKALDAAKAAQSKGATAVSAAPADKTKPSISGGKAAIFYGSSTGNTAEVAKMIKAELGDSVAHVKNITEINPIDFTVCEVMLLGIPTWHIGELQDDWALMLPELDKIDLKDKKFGLFGLGDGKGYADTYVDAMQELAAKFEGRGAKLQGFWPTEGYEFKGSKAIRNGKFIGLVIDVENQDNLSEKRVKGWCTQIRGEMGL